MISRVNFTNFLSLRNLSLKFTPGLNVLSAPTGTGKSNVISGIGWCLFNSHWFGNQDNLIQWGSKLAEVEVFFDDGQSISRTRADGKSVSFVADDKVVDNEYQYPKDRMWQLICSPQFSLTAWQSISPTQAKQHYERVFGLDIYEKYYRQSGGVLGDIKKRQSEIDGALSVLPVVDSVEVDKKKNRLEAIDEILVVANNELAHLRFGIESMAEVWGIDLSFDAKEYLSGSLIGQLKVMRKDALMTAEGVCPTCAQAIPPENQELAKRRVSKIDDDISLASSMDRDIYKIEDDIYDLNQEYLGIKEFIRLSEESSQKRNLLIEEQELNAKKIDVFERARTYLRNAPQALSPDITKFISSTASSLLRETDLSLMMEDSYNVIVYRDGRELGRQVSGGQAVLVGLALKLACMEAVQAIGVELPKLIILDEVTQGALDGDTAAVVPIMIRRYLDKGYQVIAVDHSGLWDSESANLIKLENKDGVTVWT